jgi:hypothetical protein
MSNPVLTEQQAAFILKMKQEQQPQEQTMTQQTTTEKSKRKYPIENRGINEKIRKYFADNRQAKPIDVAAILGVGLQNVYNVRHIIRKKHPRYFNPKKSVVAPVAKPVQKDVPQITHSPESYLTKPIEDLDLPVRPSNCLKLADIRTIGDLVAKRKIDLQFIRGMGDGSIKQVEDALKEIGLKLKPRAVGGRAPYPSPAPVWTPPAVMPVPEVTKSDTPDMVNSPPHYRSGGVETIDFIEAKNLNYNLGNVVKYITRADLKGNRKQDLKKAMWYLQREINHGDTK